MKNFLNCWDNLRLGQSAAKPSNRKVQRLSLTGVENNLETESTSAGNAGGKDIV